jgi:hypothetical protein
MGASSAAFDITHVEMREVVEHSRELGAAAQSLGHNQHLRRAPTHVRFDPRHRYPLAPEPGLRGLSIRSTDVFPHETSPALTSFERGQSSPRPRSV